MPFVSVDKVPAALGGAFADWTVVPGSLQKAPPKMVDNPRAGLTKADGTKEPAQLPQDTGRWQVVISSPDAGGQTRLVELTPGPMKAGLTPESQGIDPSRDVSWQVASSPADVP